MRSSHRSARSSATYVRQTNPDRRADAVESDRDRASGTGAGGAVAEHAAGPGQALPRHSFQWRSLFLKTRLAGLRDAPRPGTPSSSPISAKARSSEKLAKLHFLNEVPTVHVPGADVRAWRSLVEHRRRLVAEPFLSRTTRLGHGVLGWG